MKFKLKNPLYHSGDLVRVLFPESHCTYLGTIISVSSNHTLYSVKYDDLVMDDKHVIENDIPYERICLASDAILYSNANSNGTKCNKSEVLSSSSLVSSSYIKSKIPSTTNSISTSASTITNENDVNDINGGNITNSTNINIRSRPRRSTAGVNKSRNSGVYDATSATKEEIDRFIEDAGFQKDDNKNVGVNNSRTRGRSNSRLNITTTSSTGITTLYDDHNLIDSDSDSDSDDEYGQPSSSNSSSIGNKRGRKNVRKLNKQSLSEISRNTRSKRAAAAAKRGKKNHK